MHFPKESTLEQACCRWATSQKVNNLKLYNSVGIPDRLFLSHPAKACFVEFKRLGEEPTKIQQFMLAMLKNLGFMAVYVDNIEDFKTFITNWLRE